MALAVAIAIGISLVLVILGIDIYLAVDSVDNNTWSEIIRSFGKSTPLVPFVCGALSGHFFWPPQLKEIIPLLGQPNSIAVLIWIACLVGMIGLALTRSGMMFPLWLAFLIGIAGGVFLWPVGRW